MAKLLDLSGHKFGKLTACWPVGYALRKSVYWLCVCECGNLAVASRESLRRGFVKSCKCSQNWRPVGLRRVRKDSPEYHSWRSMRSRCLNSNETEYKRYGGVGISVCQRWDTFKNFLADMGTRPSGTTLDRFPDPNGNYEPGNCRWATFSEQRRNRRERMLES